MSSLAALIFDEMIFFFAWFSLEFFRFSRFILKLVTISHQFSIFSVRNVHICYMKLI